MAIWRIQTCKAEAGYRSNASIYNLIRDGLWTKPVPIGLRSVGWPDDEVRALCAARIGGMLVQRWPCHARGRKGSPFGRPDADGPRPSRN